MINVTVSGVHDVQEGIRRAFKTSELLKYAKDGAEVAKAWVEEELTGPKTGRKYAKYPNRSSAPGEVPAEQFGVLRAGLKIVDEAKRADSSEVLFISDSPWARVLEYGDGKDIDPRPYMRASVSGENLKKVLDAMTGPWLAGVKR